MSIIGTIIVLLVVAAVVAGAIYSIVRDKRRGIISSCGEDCSACLGVCNVKKHPKKIRKKA